MKRYMGFIAMLVCVALIGGCAQNNAKREIANKVYVYEKDGFGGDFTIALKDDGTFSYYEGLLSSYIGMGTWDLDEEILHLSDTGMQSRVENYYFRLDDGNLVYLSENSDQFLYVDVLDGERFLCDSELTKP